MGRRRSEARALWPPNVYARRNGYTYRNPLTRQERWLGTNEVVALAAARVLNKIIAPYLVDEFVQRCVWGVEGASADIADYVAEIDERVHHILQSGASKVQPKAGGLLKKQQETQGPK